MPFDQEGMWLRCQLHAHTTNSDGEATPQGLVDHYQRAGCDVLAITDHWHVTPYEHPGVLVIPAGELSAKGDDDEYDVDVLAYGIDQIPDPAEAFPSVAEAATWIVGQGGVAYLPHPYWSGVTADVFMESPDLSGIEVYNAGSELMQGSGLSAVHWDDILHRGGTCFGIACDDCHYPGQDSRLAWTMVRAAERSREAVLEALRTGSFYATSGAHIESVELLPGGGVEVRCSPAGAVFVRSGPWDGCGVNASPHAMNWRGEVLERAADGAIVAARFERPEYWTWGRVEVVGVDGGRAWSNPFTISL
jgi:hypothetical protein